MIFYLGVGGHGNDGDLLIVFTRFTPADSLSGFDAVHDRHLHVHEDDIVDVFYFESFEGFFAIVGDVSSYAETFDDYFGEFGIDRVVFNNEGVVIGLVGFCGWLVC